LKASRYNFFLEVNREAILAYNTLTTALLRLTPEEMSAIQAFCTNPQPDFFNRNHLDDLCSDLVEHGFLLINDAEDELESILELHTALKNRQKILGLTIIPTLDCNFRCGYCFSFTRPERMSQRIQQALINFTEANLPNIEKVGVTWYGGEPLLCLDMIESLSEQIKNLCLAHNVEILPASIVTNGYLLTVKAAEMLATCGVEDAQITLDGDQSTHDRRRPLRGGKGTFNTILDNLTQVKDILKIKVRINVDNENASSAVGALDALAERGLFGIPVYFGHVKPYSEACAGVSSSCLTDREFSKLDLDLTRQAIVRGFNSFQYPRLEIGGVCGADQAYTFVVAPDGMLFKCWAQASMGAEQSIGSLIDGDIDAEIKELQQLNNELFKNWNPLENPDCRECKVLPICMGGCPYIQMTHINDQNCSRWRFTLLETLGLRYKLDQMVNQSRLYVSGEM
jgi:uncharacterized protein